jgi:hypothetical protein
MYLSVQDISRKKKTFEDDEGCIEGSHCLNGAKLQFNVQEQARLLEKNHTDLKQHKMTTFHYPLELFRAGIIKFKLFQQNFLQYSSNLAGPK